MAIADRIQFRCDCRLGAGTWMASMLGGLFLIVGAFAQAATPFSVNVPRLDLGPQAGSREASVRLMSWNVKVGALFPPTMPVPQGEEAGARRGSFGRVLRALQPDVICLQEIWPLRDQSAIQDLLDRELPLANGQRWSLHRAVDVVIASHFPLRMRGEDRVIHYPLPQMPDFHYGQAMCLVDLPNDQFERDLFVFNTHFRSHGGAENIRMREDHGLSLLRRLTDLKTPGDSIDLPPKTPFIVVGDMNVYEGNQDDPLRHLRILIEGEKKGGDGDASGPDWDGSALGDLLPSVNGLGNQTYTWRNDTLPFPPGALDRLLYSDSVLTFSSAFVLKPDELEEAQLQRHGLQSSDANLAGRDGVFDHLPFVGDFLLR